MAHHLCGGPITLFSGDNLSEITNMMQSRRLHPGADDKHEVYSMCPVNHDYWAAVTDVPCPIEGCDQTVVWYEAGYVPGYRVYILIRDGRGLIDSIRHRFQADGDVAQPVLIRHDCCE